MYKAIVESNIATKIYHGSTANTFKKRYNAHLTTFRRRKYEHSTTLSTYIWKLKDKNINYKIKWEIADLAKSFIPGHKYCRLCTAEKTKILFADKKLKLNKNSEIFGKCRHKDKYLLENLVQMNDNDTLLSDDEALPSDNAESGNHDHIQHENSESVLGDILTPSILPTETN